MSKKANSTGRSKLTEHFAMMFRHVMQTPAWQALSTTAQALYPWLKLEWHGERNNNNGRLQLSVRQAAKRLGVSIDTAARAFHDLQAKAFIVITETAHLGVEGAGKSSTFELTELALPNSSERGGRRLYLQWHPGEDFPVQKAAIHNPDGRNGGRRILSGKPGRGVTDIETNLVRPS